jgi:hypothetical protein
MEENKMASEAFLHMQSSEAVVAQMAATIFGALLANQKDFGAKDAEAMVEQSVALAVKIALRTEQAIKSDEEWVRKDVGSSFLAG